MLLLVSRCSLGGVAPLAIVGGDCVVALASAFESGDDGGPDAQVSGGRSQGDVFGLAGGPKGAVVVDVASSVRSLNISWAMARLSRLTDVAFGAAVGELAD